MEPVIQVKNLKKTFVIPHQKHDSLVEYLSHPKRIFKPLVRSLLY